MVAFVAPWLLEGAIRWRVAVAQEASPARSPFAVREGLYTGAIPAHARVWGLAADDLTEAAPPLEEWPLVGSVPAFAGVLRVRGLPLGPVDGARRLALVAAARPRVRVRDSAPPAPTPEAPDPSAERPKPSLSLPRAGLAIGAAIGAALGAAPAEPIAVRPVAPRPVGPRPVGPRPVRAPDAPPPQVKLLGKAAPRRPLPPALVLGGGVGLVAILVAWFLSR
jgi:hypothetical protein